MKTFLLTIMLAGISAGQASSSVASQPTNKEVADRLHKLADKTHPTTQSQTQCQYYIFQISGNVVCASSTTFSDRLPDTRTPMLDAHAVETKDGLVLCIFELLEKRISALELEVALLRRKQ